MLNVKKKYEQLVFNRSLYIT